MNKIKIYNFKYIKNIMGKCISCGVFDKKYIYINLVQLSINLIIIILFTIFIHINISKLDTILKNKGIFQDALLTYIGQSLFIIPELFLKKRLKKETDTKSNSLFKRRSKKSYLIELIFNDYSDRITMKDRIHIALISLLMLIVNVTKAYLSLNNKTLDGNYNFIEFLFLFIISSFIYNMVYYKHQYYSIILMLVFEIIKYFLKIKYYYSSKVTVILDLLLQIVLGFFEGIIIAYLKGLMQLKFYSPYKATYIFGFINGIISLILLIAFSYIKANNIGFVEYKEEKYLDNIFFIIENYNIGQIIILFFMGIFYGAINLLYNVTINYYSVCHIFLLLQSREFSSSVNEEIQKNSGPLAISLINLCNLMELLLSLVFLEIVELNFFGLSENTKKNIQKRAEEDPKLDKANTCVSELEFFNDDNNDDSNINDNCN